MDSLEDAEGALVLGDESIINYYREKYDIAVADYFAFFR